MLRLYLGGAATRCRLNYAIEQSMKRQAKFVDYGRPAGGWGSVQSLGRSLTRERVPISGSRVLLHQNKPDGFACVSCSWAKPANPLPFEFCEEGAKATTWEITGRRCGLDFFEAHRSANWRHGPTMRWKNKVGSPSRPVIVVDIRWTRSCSALWSRPVAPIVSERIFVMLVTLVAASVLATLGGQIFGYLSRARPALNKPMFVCWAARWFVRGRSSGRIIRVQSNSSKKSQFAISLLMK